MIGDINMPIIDKKELREIRKKKFALMEQQLKEIHPNEKDRLFYHHSSEDRIVLSHALFWTMTLPQNFKSKIRKEKFFLLLRFTDLLHYCTLMYEIMPTILMSSYLREEKDSRRLAAIAVVAAGFAGDMPEELADILLDDIDYHYNKVKCRQIELIIPKLMKMVEGEMRSMR